MIAQPPPGLAAPHCSFGRVESAKVAAQSNDAPNSRGRGRLLTPRERDDEESTEAPSSALCSDAESSSGAEGGSSGSCADDETQASPGLLSLRTLGTLADQKCRQRLSAAARLKPRSRRAAFGSTPLDPIPGTPVGMSEHPPLFFPAPSVSEEGEEGEAETSPLTGPLLAQALLSTAPKQSMDPSLMAGAGLWLPTSPKRRARAAFMERAKQEGAPVKVSMQSMPQERLASTRKLALDPTMPAKKRPILADRIPRRALEPGMPVKKRVSPWIVAEPQRMLPAAPR